ncbi:MAG: PD-(D/E)XK nuclease family protein, partial [Roseburia sp.]
MALQFILGGSGSGKSTYLYQKVVEESMKNPRQNYLILVPEQFTMQTQKELISLHPKHAIMNIDVLSFNRLAFRVFDELGKTDFVVLEETGKNLVLRKVAGEKQKELKVLGGNLKKMGYIGELKSLISEFMQYNVTPEMIETVSEKETSSFSYKMQDVVTMYQGFLDYLSDTYITTEEILDLLADLAGESALLKDSTLVFDGFTGFTPIQNKLLRVLFPLVKDIYVTVTIDDRENFYENPQIQDLFFMSKKMIRELLTIAEECDTEINEPIVQREGNKKRFLHAEALYHLEQNLFRNTYKRYRKEQDSIRILTLKNPKEELLFAAGEIRRLVREEGYRYRDFAIVSGAEETYANYAKEIFDTYEIPIFMDQTKGVLFHPFTELIRAALEIIEQDFSYESVFRYYRTGLTAESEDAIDQVENYVLATGIRGYSRWSKKWVRIPKGLKEEALEPLNAIRERFVSLFTPLRETFQRKD